MECLPSLQGPGSTPNTEKKRERGNISKVVALYMVIKEENTVIGFHSAALVLRRNGIQLPNSRGSCG